MRERSTWNRHEIAKKAAEVAGDIYTMNQDHPQPAMDEYVIGDSSDFAEDVHTPNTWEVEYSNGATKRNELGMPEMRSDTFNHSEKTASDRVRLKKAELCVAVAKLMMGSGRRTASADAIEDQAVALMYMPDAELINTHKRLAQEQGQSSQFEEDDEDEGQSKQAGQVPPQFKENIEKMKAKSEDSDDDDDDEDEGQSKQAGQVPPQFKENIEKMKAKSEDKDDEDEGGGQQKQAADDDDDDDEIPDFIQKKIDDSKSDGETKQASSKSNRTIRKIRMAMGQQQQLMAQMQQLLQQAIDQQEPMDQGDPVAGLQGGPAIAQQQLPPGGQQQDLDQMLANDGLDPILEEDIEIAPNGMDTDQVVLAGEDEILRSLFAQEEESDDEDQGQSQAQSKQAGVRRTASTRTVGTRPTAGVTKLGGSVSKTASKQVVDSLSSLWSSAPDVRAAFGMK
jgi:hypothetical protein